MTAWARRVDRTRSKYGAKPCVVDGIRFHSQREAARYQELRLAEKAGVVRGLTRQPRFELTVTGPNGEVERIGEYRGDFEYDVQYAVWRDGVAHEHWRHVVEDVKGWDTPLSKWKRRHLQAQYDLSVEIVR